MFDVLSEDVSGDLSAARSNSVVFTASKRVFDVLVSIMLLPALLILAAGIAALNMWLNPGPLIFKQERMGRRCRAFTAYKFRSMQCVSKIERSANDPVESNRITKLGQILRRYRIDELPQVINVLKGEMSFVGPRPDYFPHAEEFLRQVPGYRERHSVRPGISGLAQTEIGYVQGPAETRRKVMADLYYIRNASFRLEAWILWRTLCTVFGRKGV